MRTRFLVSVGLADIGALLISFGIASLLVYDTLLPWNSSHGADVFPMLAALTVSMIAMSLVTDRMSGHGVPRPTYGRMTAIFVGTGALTAMFLVLFRDTYFSRAFLLSTAGSWLVLATAHRIYFRRRPWSERIAVISAEKPLSAYA